MSDPTPMQGRHSRPQPNTVAPQYPQPPRQAGGRDDSTYDTDPWNGYEDETRQPAVGEPNAQSDPWNGYGRRVQPAAAVSPADPWGGYGGYQPAPGRSRASRTPMIVVIIVAVVAALALGGVLVWHFTADKAGQTITSSQIGNKDKESTTTPGTGSDTNADDSGARFATVKDMLADPTIRRQLDQGAQTASSDDMSVQIKTQGSNTLVYDMTVSDDVASGLRDTLDSSGVDGVYQSMADTLAKQVKGGVSIRLYVHSASGSTVIDKTFDGVRSAE